MEWNYLTWSVLVLFLNCAVCGITHKYAKNQPYGVTSFPKKPKPVRRAAVTYYTTTKPAPVPTQSLQYYRDSSEDTTEKKLRMKTRAPRETEMTACEIGASYCIVPYMTGKLCGRSVYHTYQTFKNWCQMDFVNCNEGYEVWQIAHMGICYEPPAIAEYIHYEYMDDLFLDQIYVLQE